MVNKVELGDEVGERSAQMVGASGERILQLDLAKGQREVCQVGQNKQGSAARAERNQGTFSGWTLMKVWGASKRRQQDPGRDGALYPGDQSLQTSPVTVHGLLRFYKTHRALLVSADLGWTWEIWVRKKIISTI